VRRRWGQLQPQCSSLQNGVTACRGSVEDETLVIWWTGNPDTVASAASRCADGAVLLARVACGKGRGYGETNTVHVGITRVDLEERQLSFDESRRSRGELARQTAVWQFSGKRTEPIRRGQLPRTSSTEYFRWRKLRWASLLGRCFRGNSGAEVREVSSTGRILQSVLTEWRHWGQLRRHRSISLARWLPTIFMAAGVVVSTSWLKRATPTTGSMVNGLASALLATALLALVE
jgi:hypothetical protein